MHFVTSFVGSLVVAGSLLLAQDQATSLLYAIKNPTPGERLMLQQHFDVLGNCCGGGANATGPLEVVVQGNQVRALLAIAPGAQFVDFGRPFHDVELERAIAAGLDVPDPGYFTVAEIEASVARTHLRLINVHLPAAVKARARQISPECRVPVMSFDDWHRIEKAFTATLAPFDFWLQAPDRAQTMSADRVR